MMAIEKEFVLHLHLNWKDGSVKVFKKEHQVSGYWVPIRLRLRLLVPESVPEISATVELPDTKVADIVVEELSQ
ncbi:MAG: hypothetical protein ABIH46_11620 [Chloroflexota bacterium]